MYSKRATSTSRRGCKFPRQTSSAFGDWKQLSTAELSKQFYDGADVTVQIEYDFPVIDVSDVD